MFRQVRNNLIRFLRDEDGPTAVEYAVLLAIISGGALVALADFGDRVHEVYVRIRAALATADP